LHDLRAALEQSVSRASPLLGVGERAFPRAGPALLLEGYRILCYLRTSDLQEIRRLTPVDCLQEELPDASVPCRDTLSLLSHPLLGKACGRPPQGSRLLVYRETPALRDLAVENGWTLLANPSEMRARWENKLWFRTRFRDARLSLPPWEVFPMEELSPRTYRTLHGRWGSHLVVQIPDFPRGGGRSTFFVGHEEEMDALGAQLAHGHHRGHSFQEVLVSSLIEGPSLSIEGCVTPWGVLISPLQIQLVDLEDLLPSGLGGRFCGHQWGAPDFPPEVEDAAREMVQRVGDGLMTEGYRGIFGLDLALDQRTGRLYALECNPRYTGAFPALTILQLSKGLPPLEAFHLLAWLGSDRPVPVAALNDARARLPAASQLLLFHRGSSSQQVYGSLPAGRYRWEEANGRARMVGNCLPLSSPPWDPMEFLVLDGPPQAGTRLLPGEELERLVRVFFLRPVLQDGGRLEPTVVRIIRWVYDHLRLADGPEDRT
jgi:hypothetical protein